MRGKRRFPERANGGGGFMIEKERCRKDATTGGKRKRQAAFVRRRFATIEEAASFAE